MAYQYVTLVAAGGTPVRLANQTGAAYATTGTGSLVFGNGAVLTNPTLNGATFNTPFGFIPGTLALPSIYFPYVLDYSTGIWSSAIWTVNIAANSTALARFTYPGDQFLTRDLSVGRNVTSGTWQATTVAVPYGGTGFATAAQNGVVFGNAASALGVTAAGTTGQVLVATTGVAPSWAALSGIGVTSLGFGTTGLTPSGATTGAISVAGVLVGANGGTGVANTGMTLTLGGNMSTGGAFTTVGAFAATLTLTNTTTLTLPLTGTLATLAGAEALTNKTYNGNTWTAGTGVLTLAAAKTLTANNTLTLAGTDGTTMTFPTTSASVARTDAANTFTGVQTFSTPIAVGSVATMTATVGGGVPTPPNNTTTFLRGDATFATIVAAGLTVGTSAIASGTTTRILYNNAGVLGEYTITGTGTVVAMAAGPTFTGTLTASAGAFSSTLTSAALTVTSASAQALVVGLNGATNPVFTVDASTATQVAGFKITGAVTGGTVALAATDSGANTNVTLDAKGSGTIVVAGTSTGAITLTRATTISAALTYGGVTLTNNVTGSGKMVLDTSPTIATPVLTKPSITSGSNIVAQGRLTLTTAVPVLVATVSAATTIFYALYSGNQIQIYDGTNMVLTPFTELSNITSNSAVGSAGPAVVANNSNYDLFVWSNAGTVTLTRGPLWTSDTARGVGAGTTELQMINGVWTNKIAITNGPAANRGTYVGTVRSNGTASIDFILGAIAANGTAAVMGVWNAYNRVEYMGLIGDSTDSWAWATASWRSANASNTMRVSVVVGLQEDFFNARFDSFYSNSGAGGNNGYGGVGYDSTTAISGTVIPQTSLAAGSLTAARGSAQQQPFGFHYFQALEYGAVGGTFYGDNGSPTILQSGLGYQGRF